MRSPDQVEGWHKAGILVLNSSLRNSLRNSKTRDSGCKTRLQDFRAIFSFKAAALAVGRRSGSVRKSFATAFQA